MNGSAATVLLNEWNNQGGVKMKKADAVTFDRWFKIAIIAYVIIEAVCIVVLIYLWL
jgi:hypothetical protein